MPVVSKILCLIGNHGYVVAAMLEEMQDVKGSARRNFDTLNASGRVVWRHQCCGGGWLSTYIGKLQKKWTARGWELSFGRDSDNEYVLRSMIWETTTGYSATIVRF